MNFNSIQEFDKDFKRLLKKYRTLEEDFLIFKKVLNKYPLGNGRHSTILTKKNDLCIIKTRLFCRSLKGSSLRVIYSYRKDKKFIELISIDFIELYFKGDKASEDKDRIKNYLKS
jgi:hypothetical protein